jgi:hypothetical protein
LGVFSGGNEIQEAVALIIQKFGEDVALSHLHRFTDRCEAEGIPAVQMPRTCSQSDSGMI